MGLTNLAMEMPAEVITQVKSESLKSQSFEENLEMRKNWANETRGKLTGIDCPLCKNRGYSIVIRQGALANVECSCMAARRSMQRIERSGMKDLIDSCTFSSFKVNKPWQAEMKRRAQDFLKDKSEKWFAAMGSVGAGKTHICTAICGELLSAGKEVRYMLWRDDSVRLKAAVNDVEEYDRLIKPLKTVSVLYIDDLFKTKKGKEISQADINLAFELLNYRYCNKSLRTIISSEMTIDEIVGIDEGVGSRIYERCKGFCLELTGDKNWRLV